MPDLVWFLFGLILALPIAFRLARRKRKIEHRAEFWVFSASTELLTSASLKLAVTNLPPDLVPPDTLDPWTFSDVRWRLGDGDRRTLPHAFDPGILGLGPTETVEITRSDRITKLLFVGETGLEGFPLATVTAGALAAARSLSAVLIWDHVSKRAWIPRDLAGAVKKHGLLSPEVHLHARWADGGAHGVLRVMGFAKRGGLDLETLPVPVDFRLIAEETTDAYARHLWSGTREPFRYEAFGDGFEIAARPGRRVVRLRIFRRRTR